MLSDSDQMLVDLNAAEARVAELDAQLSLVLAVAHEQGHYGPVHAKAELVLLERSGHSVCTLRSDEEADAEKLPLARYILDFFSNRNRAELSPAIGAMGESDRELLLGELSRILRFGGHPPNWVSPHRCEGDDK